MYSTSSLTSQLAGFSASNHCEQSNRQLHALSSRQVPAGWRHVSCATSYAIGGVAHAAIKFTDCFDQIRQNPASIGFVISSHAPVAQLLDTFFLVGARARRLSSGPPSSLQGGQAVALSMMVPHGNAQMGIVDGPTALDYMFNVIRPPAGLGLTMQDHCLPLTVPYSWAVYIPCFSFLGAPPTVLPDIEAVPRMTCVMSIERKNLAAYFFLGQTRVGLGAIFY